MKKMTMAMTGGLYKSSISLMLLFSMLLVLLFPNPTLSKYVLDTIDYDVSFSAVSAYPITAIGVISGDTRIGNTLTAGALTPFEATATYQWQVSDSIAGPYTDILGASSASYTLSQSEYQKYIRIVATGTHSFSGTITSEARGPVSECEISAMSPIVGSAVQGHILTAGTVFPLGSTVTYQWQKSQDGVNFTNIPSATSNSYMLQGGDAQYFIKVLAIGNGFYTGTAAAVTASKVTSSAGIITAIGPVNGITQVGRELLAGELTPYGATATYQWQSSDTGADSSFMDIPGAAYRSYITTISDYNKYIRVVARGSASFLGTVTSNVVGPINYGQINAIGDIRGTTAIGNVLNAGSLTPAGATVSYQWKKATLPNGLYEDIPGATDSSYALKAGELGYYIKVFATGTGSYFGTVESAPAGPVSNTFLNITGIGDIYGTARVGSTLTAGEVTPSGANVNYQWQISASSSGGFSNIEGANSNSYLITAGDYRKYIRVVTTGAGSFSGLAISNPIGPIGQCLLTSMSPILGTVVPGHVLMAGAITPADATVDYQWQMATDWEGTSYVNVGSNSDRFLVSTAENGRYIKLIVTGKGSYAGTLTAITLSRVGLSDGQITAIGDIGGTAQVGSTLTTGALTPSNAVVTYQWQSSDTGEENSFTNILGATDSFYTLASSDCYKYIRLTVKGSGRYTGDLVSLAKGPVLPLMITDIDKIIGTTTVGGTLTAGSLTPADAIATYQWQRTATLGGVYEDISGATGLNYTITDNDLGYYFKVKATGTGSYLGTVTSSYAGPISGSVIQITSMGSTSGVVKVGSRLTAGALSPAKATANYQWQRSDTLDGVYTNIVGATSVGYNLTVNDYEKYIRVIAKGSGNYSGSLISSPSGPVAQGSLISMSPIIGANVPGQVLSAGAIMPTGATVDYQWMRSDDWQGTTYSNTGTNSSTLVLTTADNGRYIRLVVTGKGAYSGSLTATTLSQVQASSGTITGIGDITGTVRVGSTLTAGAVMPTNAKITYQWQSSNTDTESGFANVYGATTNTYTLNLNDYGKYIRVVVKGAGTYIGSAVSKSAGPVGLCQITGIGAISGTTMVGESLTAGTLTPMGATATYQWRRASSPDGIYEDVPGATEINYTLMAADEGYYLKVKATGNGSNTGTVTSAYTGPVGNSALVITSMGSITGTSQVNGNLTAGNLEPAGATATFQWQVCDSIDGIYSDIQGATFASYTPIESDYQKYLRVVATGSGNYNGTFISMPTEQITACPLISMSPIVGTIANQQLLTAGTIMPYGATVKFQWQKTDWDGNNPINITGATASSFMLSTAQNGGYIRLVVTGTGAYSGTISAITLTRMGNSLGAITAIGDIEGVVQVGSILNVGLLTPSDATATYQWQSSDIEDVNGFSNIYGATLSSYTLTTDDSGKYIRVVATGSGNNTGNVFSGLVGPVSEIVPMDNDLDGLEGTESEALAPATMMPEEEAVPNQTEETETQNQEPDCLLEVEDLEDESDTIAQAPQPEDEFDIITQEAGLGGDTVTPAQDEGPADPEETLPDNPDPPIEPLVQEPDEQEEEASQNAETLQNEVAPEDNTVTESSNEDDLVSEG